MSDYFDEKETEQWGSYGKVEPEPVKEPTVEELEKLEANRAQWAESARKRSERIKQLEQALRNKWAADGLAIVTYEEKYQTDDVNIYRRHELVRDGQMVASVEEGEWDYIRVSGDSRYQLDLYAWVDQTPREDTVDSYKEWL